MLILYSEQTESWELASIPDKVCDSCRASVPSHRPVDSVAVSDCCKPPHIPVSDSCKPLYGLSHLSIATGSHVIFFYLSCSIGERRSKSQSKTIRTKFLPMRSLATIVPLLFREPYYFRSHEYDIIRILADRVVTSVLLFVRDQIATSDEECVLGFSLAFWFILSSGASSKIVGVT
jgi:hypothetical protein